MHMVIAAAISDRLHLKWWFVSAWQSAEFWRNALGRPPCWTKTASLRTGARICTTTLCGIFWIIYLLLSITSSSCFGPVSQTFAGTHSMAPSASSHLRALPGEIKWKKWLNYLCWPLIKRYYVLTAWKESLENLHEIDVAISCWSVWWCLLCWRHLYPIYRGRVPSWNSKFSVFWVDNFL